ncbi:hypothetical protein Q5P01_022682 [Channa striata]|uniref:Uncharacterized protein n=1 Tax=Channa striata TaxID=64152 RepID=A0AA88LRG0_CHASR|nr:hypothetical protein Q5P01_022682 [Channa striata]
MVKLANSQFKAYVMKLEKKWRSNHSQLGKRVTVRSVKQDLFNNSSAARQGRDPHVAHNEEAHDTKTPARLSELINSCRRIMNLNYLT